MTYANSAFIVTPANMMNKRAASDFDSNQRDSGIGLGPKGIIASGSYPSFGFPGLIAEFSLPPSRKAVVSSSRDAIRTYPPRGSAASTYSVSPKRFFRSDGPNPMEKRGAYTP